MKDRLREAIEEECVVETTGWAAERVARVAEALQRGVAAEARLEVLVIWLQTARAFTAPGRTIYISRRLLECLHDDDSAAMVIAHEIAHHEMGHLTRLPFASALFHPERETDADRRAIERCIEAGYDVERCLQAFRHINEVVLDYQDIEGSLGPDVDDDLVGRARRWWWQRRRGYASVTERIEEIRRHAQRYREGTADARRDAAEARRRARRRIAMAVTTAVVLVLLPRPRVP